MAVKYVNGVLQASLPSLTFHFLIRKLNLMVEPKRFLDLLIGGCVKNQVEMHDN